MKIERNIVARARNKSGKIVLTEGEDRRIQEATVFLLKRRIARIILLGNPDKIFSECPHLSFFGSRLEIINPPTSGLAAIFSLHLYRKRKKKGLSINKAKYLISHPLYFGGMLVAAGYADGGVSGAVYPTAEVIRSGIHTIGLSKRTDFVSSSFLMLPKDGRPLTYADCGVIPEPTPEQLASIAAESARSHRILTGELPRVALLSFSTKGSAVSQSTERMRKALHLIRKNSPQLVVDGELQFDAAFVPEISRTKCPDSPLKGKANVMIFPNLDAANIGYKITERLGNAVALGPLLQGLNKPWMDLSRGCSGYDVALVAAIACLNSGRG